MTFKEVVKRKVPVDIQETSEFKTFLSLIKREEITNPIALQKHIESELDDCKKKLVQYSATSSMNRLRVRCAEKIAFLKLVRDKILKYL